MPDSPQPDPPGQPHAPRQPWLHELAVAVLGNVTVVSDAGGDIAPLGAQGLYVDDRRVVSRLDLDVQRDHGRDVPWSVRLALS